MITTANIIFLVVLFLLGVAALVSIGILTHFVITNFGTEGMHWALAASLLLLVIMILVIIGMFLYNLYSPQLKQIFLET